MEKYEAMSNAKKWSRKISAACISSSFIKENDREELTIY